MVSRQQLYANGVTRWAVEAELRSGRWRSLGRQSIQVSESTNAREANLARFRSAVFEVGADAALDGSTALDVAGLRGYDDPVVRISVSKGSRFRRPRGVRVYETRRRKPGDVIGGGIPRVRPPIAAVRGALWARTRRQGALMLIMPVQQRLVRVAEVAEALDTVKRHRRRRFLVAILADVRDGAHAMGELDFARMCRRRGLPEPERQKVRRGRGGRVYLDVRWDRWGVVAEVEGVHHEWESEQVPDTLRQNEVVIGGDAVLRIPVVGLRDCPDPYLDQVAAMLCRAGWTGPS